MNIATMVEEYCNPPKRIRLSFLYRTIIFR